MITELVSSLSSSAFTQARLNMPSVSKNDILSLHCAEVYLCNLDEGLGALNSSTITDLADAGF